jgi:hypothetical protein
VNENITKRVIIAIRLLRVGLIRNEGQRRGKLLLIGYSRSDHHVAWSVTDQRTLLIIHGLRNNVRDVDSESGISLLVMCVTLTRHGLGN